MTTLNIAESYTVGEIPAPILYTFLDGAGTVIDMTGFTVKFQYERIIDSSTVVVRNGALATAAAGEVEYTWIAADFATAGFYRAQFWAGNGTNRYASPVIHYKIVSGVGTAPAI